jgi:formylglycine-generating enzyme required for sulfatase activity
MAAALDLVRARGRTNPIRQIHVAGSSDPYPMPYGLRLNGAADTNFAIVGGYDVNFVGTGASTRANWISGTGSTRLVFANPCGNGQATCPGTEPLAGYAHVEPAIEVIDPRQVIFRRVTVEVPIPPTGFGAVAGVSCRVSNALLGTCSGLTLDRVAIKMAGGAPGVNGVAGTSYARPAASSTITFASNGSLGALGCRGSGAGGQGGRGNTLAASRTGGIGSNDIARGGGYPGVKSTDKALLPGKRGFTPSDAFWAAAGGFRAQRTLPLSVFANGDGSNGPAGGGGGGGAGWEVFGGGGGAGGGCGGGGGTAGGPGGSAFGLISASSVDLPTTVMTSIQMGPGGSGGSGGDGGVGQQGGTVVEGDTPFEKPALTSDADWAASRRNAAYIPPGGPGGSGGGGGGGAGGSGGWSVGVAKPATLAIPLSLGVSVASNFGIAGAGGAGGSGGPSIGLDLPPAPAIGSAGDTGLPGGSISSCVLFGAGAAGDVACGLSTKRSLGSFCQADSECVSTNCASSAEGSSNDRCAPLGMAYIPAGSFAMGRYRGTDTETYHQVEITRPFFLGRKEFTTTADWAGLTPAAPTQFSWFDAMDFANGRSFTEGLTQCYTSGAFSADGLDCDGYRLPTAAEFEYALRAGTRDEAYWGPFTDPIGRDYEVLGLGAYQITGAKLPNPWGLYDMAGNSPEWTLDNYYIQSPPSVFDPGVFSPGTKSSSGWGIESPGSLPSVRRSSIESGFSSGFRLARTVRPPVEAGTCPMGFHVEVTPSGNQCRTDVSVCTLANGKGRQLYGRPGGCTATVCDLGYTAVGNACLAVLGTSCSVDADCAEGLCSTSPAGTANDRCAPAGMVFAPAGVYAYPTGKVAPISRGFFIAKTETTQLEWKQFANGANPSSTTGKLDEAPVNQVDWYAAAAYANARSAREGLTPCYDLTSCTDAATTGWFDGDFAGCSSVPAVSLSCTGYRLPTVTEWMHAAKSGTTTALVSNDSTAWTSANASNRPRAVAGKNANPLGLHDMSGNVWEMTEDPSYAAPTSTKEVDLLATNTGGNATVQLMGGSYTDTNATSSEYLTKSYNWPSKSRADTGNNVGFRLVRSVVAPLSGPFCPAGFHAENGACESDTRACVHNLTSGAGGRQRWSGRWAWADECESVCAPGQLKVGRVFCYSVPSATATCSTASDSAGPVTTAPAFGNYPRLGAQTSIVSSSFAAGDAVGGYRDNRYSERIAVSLSAGQVVDVYMDGSPVDAYLQVYGGSSCGLLGENDDQSSTTRNAGLRFVAPTTGTYFIIATTYAQYETGNYTLYIVKR